MSERDVNKNLTLRHIQFLALGSAIGTGLFYGSSESIKLAGPSVIFGYLLVGFIIYIVMKSLGDLILNTPTGKTFGDYASIYLGKKWGFVTGWAYALEMIIVCIADLTAFGIYMKFWFPEIDAWIWIALLIFIITAINLINVRVFGELEFILTIIKVIAIGFMIVIGMYLLSGLSSNSQVPLSHINNLTKYGGFFPNDILGFIFSLSIIAFSFGGIEIIGISAGETAEPKKSIPIAIRSVPFRIIFFYVLTIFIILTIVPWNSLGDSKSPFVIIFEYIGIPYSASILNAVVISASISAINSDIFSASRMIYSMAKRNQAPNTLCCISKYGIPWKVVLSISITLFIGVFLNYLFPDKVFIFVASAAGVITIFVWLMILFAKVSMENNRFFNLKNIMLNMKLQALSILFLLFIIVSMLFYSETRASTLVGCILITSIFILASKFNQNKIGE